MNKILKSCDYTTLDNWLINTKGTNKKFADSFFQNESYWLDSVENNNIYITHSYFSKEMCYNSRIELALRIFKEFENIKSVSVYQTLIFREDCYDFCDSEKKKLLPYHRIKEIILNKDKREEYNLKKWMN